MRSTLWSSPVHILFRLVLAVATLSSALDAARAASGDPDPSFGTGGVVTLSSTLLSPTALALLDDGRIVVAGTNGGLKVARFDSGGTLDATFGVGGIAPASLGTFLLQAIAVQPDGSVVLAGSFHPAMSIGFFALGRLDPSGVPDPGFGTGGLVTVDFDPSPGPGPSGYAAAVAIQPDGRIVASGVVADLGTVVVRFEADGTLDPSFDGDGIAVSPFFLDFIASYVGVFEAPKNQMALQPDGGIVLGGGAAHPALLGAPIVAALRQTAGGLPDTGFGASGIVTVPVLAERPRGSRAEAVALQADGKILLAGEIGRGLPTAPPFEKTDMAVARLLADGSPDPSFRRTGATRLHAGRGSGAGFVGTQSDAKIVVVGNWATRDRGGLAAFRLMPDGRRDRSFGRAGKILLDGAVVTGAALQPDDRLVVVADTHAGTWELRRFLP